MVALACHYPYWFVLPLKDLMTFFLKVADNEKWQADFRKMSVYEKMTIISWTQYLKRLWFISSTKHEMSLHLLIHPNMVAVISRFDKYVEIWIEHKRKTCIDGYYKKSFDRNCNGIHCQTRQCVSSVLIHGEKLLYFYRHYFCLVSISNL